MSLGARARSRASALFLAGLGVILFASAPVEAQEASEGGGGEQSLLDRAEAAYQAIDYEAALSLAREAMEQGTADRGQLVRIFELSGIVAATLRREDESRQAFVRLLALDPAAQVNQRLAPPLRGPFAEALGYWASRDERFEADATLIRRRDRLRVTIHDPVHMAATVELGARIDPDAEFVMQRRELDDEGTVYLTLEGASAAERVEFYVRVLDDYGNRLLEIGNEDEPIEVTAPRAAPTPLSVAPASPPPAPSEGEDVLASPLFWILSAAAVLLVGGGVVTGVLLNDPAVGATFAISFGVR